METLFHMLPTTLQDIIREKRDLAITVLHWLTLTLIGTLLGAVLSSSFVLFTGIEFVSRIEALQIEFFIFAVSLSGLLCFFIRRNRTDYPIEAIVEGIWVGLFVFIIPFIL